MSNAKLVIAPPENLELEIHLENWLENSPRSLTQEPLLWIGRQTSAQDEEGTIYSDLLGVDSQGNLVIAELKRGRTPRDIMAQLLDYAAWAEGLSDAEVRRIAEDYFKKPGRFQAKTFDDAFRIEFEMPESEELPSLNRGLRLFIVAENITPRASRVCRFLRTSYGMNISCIAVSAFKTEAGEMFVTTDVVVGDEDMANSKTQRKHTSRSSPWLGDKPLDQVVWEAVQELMQAGKEYFTLKELREPISVKYPDLEPVSRVDYQVYSDCVNFSKRSDYPSGTNRYWWISRGKYRLYDPEKDKKQVNNG